MALILALVLVLLAAVSRPTAAVTWKLSKSVEAVNLTAWNAYVPDEGNCSAPGVCLPFSTTLPKGTLWYWCGWRTTERTEYWVNVVKPSNSNASVANITAVLMREADVRGCAVANLSTIKTCPQLEYTMCDTQPSCQMKLYGMAFSDPMCLLVANNDGSLSAPVQIKMRQYPDSARLYGTAFATILFVTCVLMAVSSVAYGAYLHSRRPVHRIHELDKIARAQTGQNLDLILPLVEPAAPDTSVTTADSGATSLVGKLQALMGNRAPKHA